MLRRYGFRLATIAIAALALGSAFASATFGDPATSTSNVFSADVLNAPTALSATVAGTTVNLSWTGTSNTYASGHRVLRGTVSGGPYTQIAQITPRTTTTYADSTGGGTFYYVVRAYFQNWESANSNQASAIPVDNLAPAVPTALAAVDRPLDQGFALDLTWTPSTSTDVTQQLQLAVRAFAEGA